MPKYYTINKEYEYMELTKEEYQKNLYLMGSLARGYDGYELKHKKRLFKKIYFYFFYKDNKLIQTMVKDYEEEN